MVVISDNAQVFKAIEKYGVPLTRKQAETFGQCILVCLPSYPEKSQIPGWQCLIPHLQAFAYELQAADGKVGCILAASWLHLSLHAIFVLP